MKKFNYRTTQLDVRGLNYHIQEWGEDSKPLLILLHGWMDCGASFKFMAQYLADSFHIVAPDFRGFGETDHVSNGYWFPDYYADLEVLINHYSPNDKVDLAGHSMGANIALIYSGLMNDRVNRVMAIDGLGLPESKSSDAPAKQRQWIKDSLTDRGSKVYADKGQLKASIKTMNPELSDLIVEELCELWARPGEQQGTFILKHDHKHRHANPYRYLYSDVKETWKEVKADVSIVIAKNSWLFKRAQESDRIDEARQILNVSDDNFFVVEETGHMLHLEQPEATANVVKKFFS